MRARPAVIVGVSVVLGACGGAPVPASRVAVRWTDRAFGEQHSTSHEQLALPFELDPQGTSGTAVVLGLLRAAEQRGARYVSDVAIALQLRRGGTPIECVSRFVLAGGPPAAPAPGDPSDASAARSFQPTEVDARVTDRDLRCEQQQTIVVGERGMGEAGIGGRFDGSVGGSVERGGLITPVAGVEFQDHCEVHPVERTVRRYDHFVAARFAPPELATIGRDHAGGTLVEEPPVCHPINVEPGAPLQHRIQAEVFYSRSPAR
jgi:hypothetical protein